MTNKNKKIYCAGNALLDITAFVGHDFFTGSGIQPGSTNHVDEPALGSILARLENPLRLAGGGAANTAKVFAALGGSGFFAGSVGNDSDADFYARDMNSHGVETALQNKNGMTGVFCALIQPDGKRTVFVNSGVASTLDSTSMPASFFGAETILHVDGFLAADPVNFENLIRRAADKGSRVSFDVGGKGMAMKNRELFKGMISLVSWVFMNEDEYSALSGKGVDESLADFSAGTEATLIVKRAEVGAVCFSGGNLVQSPVRKITPLDETGAGDAFAAGFLFAAMNGASLPRCMRLANRVAEHIIQVPGLQLNKLILQTIAAEFL